MPDLLLRDTDRSELVAEIAAEVVAALRPVLAESAEPQLVDGDCMADRAGISRPTLDRLRAKGLIPSVLIGRRRLYLPAAVIEALLSNEDRASDARIKETAASGLQMPLTEEVTT